MTKAQKSSTLIIFVSAVLVAILFNMKVVVYLVHELSESNNVLDFKDRSMARIHFGLVTFVFHGLVFYLTALFNYSWSARLFSKKMTFGLRVPLIILVNCAVLYLLSFMESRTVYALFAWMGKDHWTVEPYLYINISIAALAVAAGYLILLIQKVRQAEIENVRLREEKANAELTVLKEQISPHFFFNTLNSLSSVIRTEEKADSLDFVERMSEVYRYILDSESKDTVPLAEELEFLEAYTHLLIKRFGKNLKVSISIDKNLNQQVIPPLALQVLMENVVKHNTLSSEDPILVNIRSSDGFVSVENSVNPIKQQDGHGVGLANLNKRYKMIMGREIEIQSDTTRFLVKLPLD